MSGAITEAFLKAKLCQCHGRNTEQAEVCAVNSDQIVGHCLRFNGFNSVRFLREFAILLSVGIRI